MSQTYEITIDVEIPSNAFGQSIIFFHKVEKLYLNIYIEYFDTNIKKILQNIFLYISEAKLKRLLMDPTHYL